MRSFCESCNQFFGDIRWKSYKCADAYYSILGSCGDLEDKEPVLKVLAECDRCHGIRKERAAVRDRWGVNDKDNSDSKLDEECDKLLYMIACDPAFKK